MLEQNIFCELCAGKEEVLWYLLKRLLLLLVLLGRCSALRLADRVKQLASWIQWVTMKGVHL